MRRFLSIVFWFIFISSLVPALRKKEWDTDDIIVQAIFSGVALVMAINFWRRPKEKAEAP